MDGAVYQRMAARKTASFGQVYNYITDGVSVSGIPAGAGSDQCSAGDPGWNVFKPVEGGLEYIV